MADEKRAEAALSIAVGALRRLADPAEMADDWPDGGCGRVR